MSDAQIVAARLVGSSMHAVEIGMRYIPENSPRFAWFVCDVYDSMKEKFGEVTERDCAVIAQAWLAALETKGSETMNLFDIARRLKSAGNAVKAAARSPGIVKQMAQTALSGVSNRAKRSMSGMVGADGILSKILQSIGLSQVASQTISRGRGGKALDEMGPLGKAVKSLVNPRVTGDPVEEQRELELAANLLRAATGQRKEYDDVHQIPDYVPEQEEIDEGRSLDTSGYMFRVQSSNVYSIGFILSPDKRTGTLLVCYLGGRGKKRSGPGSLYEYMDVPLSLWRSFQRARSAGTFVWDELRVRGTISGHRFAYHLAGIVNGYIPRQAAVIRGKPGEHFVKRRFRGRESQLPNQQVSRSGPNPRQSRARPQDVNFVARNRGR